MAGGGDSPLIPPSTKNPIYIYNIYIYVYILYVYVLYIYYICIYIYMYIYIYIYIYALNLFTEHSGKHWWEQNAFCSFTIPQGKMAKLSTWWFQHSVDISSSLLVNPSHTDESLEEWCESLFIELLTVMSSL